MDTRNPSPPRDSDHKPSHALTNDQIGESAYSKRWLYSLTLQVLTTISREHDNTNNPTGCDDDLLSTSLEEELCCLWDITADKTLLPHLRHFQLVQIFSSCVIRSRSPRLTEISIGILANLTLDDVACGLLTEETDFMSIVLNLLTTDDTRILIELFRLLRSVLASRAFRQTWLDAIHFAPEFIDRINFILCSSTNANLLMNTITVIETVLRIDDSICEMWCTEKLFNSLQEAQHQMSWIHGDEVETIYRLLYIFSSNPTGVRTLMSSYLKLFPGFGVVLRKVCEDEAHLIPFKKYNASLRLVLPIVDVIISNLPPTEALKSLQCDPEILPCLIRITRGCIALNFVSDDLSLDGLWEDLSVFFGDLIARVREFLEECVADEESSQLPLPQPLLSWLQKDIEGGEHQSREAFVRCCLARRRETVEEVRGHLVFVCHRLGLAQLLECSTTTD